MGTIIILLIIGIVLAIPLGILLLGAATLGKSQAKKEAKKILAMGKIENPRKFKRTMGVLAKTSNDLEASDLWKKLQSLSEQS